MSASSLSQTRPLGDLPWRLNKRVPLLVAGAIAVGLIAGALATAGHVGDVVGLAAVLIPVVIWKRPQLGPLVLMMSALLIEQTQELIQPTGAGDLSSTASVPTVTIPVTNKVPLFSGIGSLHIEPADLLLLTVLIVYLVRCSSWGPRWWPSSRVAGAIAIVMGFVVYGLVLGLLDHGSLRESLQEIRPFFYLAATYVLTSVLIRSRKAFHMMLWGFVIAEAVKALQGLYVYLETRSWSPRPDSVLSHEEAYFFSIYILLVLALWMFGQRGRLRTTATSLLPLIFFVDLVNNRRTAWLVLGGGLLTLVAIGYFQLPDRRRQITRGMIVALLLSAVYFPLFWNNQGTLGQPATALKSEFSPDPRDASSDLYRDQENANLQYNIKHDGILGAGFGVPIDYALPIDDLRQTDPLLDYIPHNGVLYVMMRLGLLGTVAFWSMMAAAIIAGCRLAKAMEREIAMVGALSACAIVGYALDGATDQGFYLYRIAFVTGCLLGLAEAGRHLLETSRPRRRDRSGPLRARRRPAHAESDDRTSVSAR